MISSSRRSFWRCANGLPADARHSCRHLMRPAWTVGQSTQLGSLRWKSRSSLASFSLCARMLSSCSRLLGSRRSASAAGSSAAKQ